MISVRTATSQGTTRKQRRPNFPFAGTMKPFGLYPIWAHPVLPGETLQAVSAKMRAISMPVIHPLTGAWLENWMVYVKFTDLDRDLGQSFISDTYPTTGYVAGADSARYFHKAGQIDWIKKAVERVHRAWFVHDGETPRTIDGVPKVKLNNISWNQNVMLEPTDEAVPTTDASDMYQHLQGWMMMQQMNLTELTYEGYLETFGVKSVAKNVGDPEILAFARNWTQPVNTVEPTTGAPSSAYVWSQDFKTDKPKRFDEPGFLIMLSCVRPKLYQANLAASMIGNMWGFADWFPSYNLEDPTAGIKKMLSDDPVFAAAAQDAGVKDLIYDHRDLLSHGEQFVNTGTHPYRLPVTTGLEVKTASEPEDMRGEYAKDADIDALFAGDQKVVYYEGMGSATISGHITDTTR